MAGPWGAFGKIPAMGDFLRSETPPGFVEVWDPWLQAVLLSARRNLGQRWQECYFSAPIWRFTLAQGLAGRLPVLGILMPSVDRVGRQFPLTLMAPLPQGAPVLLTHLAADAAFARLEELALEALERDLAWAQLMQRLATLPRMSAPRAVSPGGHAGALTLVAPPDRPLGADLLAPLLDARLRQPSIWSTLLADGNRLMATATLPRDADATALFDLTAPSWAAGAAA